MAAAASLRAGLLMPSCPITPAARWNGRLLRYSLILRRTDGYDSVGTGRSKGLVMPTDMMNRRLRINSVLGEDDAAAFKAMPSFVKMTPEGMAFVQEGQRPSPLLHHHEWLRLSFKEHP